MCFVEEWLNYHHHISTYWLNISIVKEAKEKNITIELINPANLWIKWLMNYFFSDCCWREIANWWRESPISINSKMQTDRIVLYFIIILWTSLQIRNKCTFHCPLPIGHWIYDNTYVYFSDKRWILNTYIWRAQNMELVYWCAAADYIHWIVVNLIPKWNWSHMHDKFQPEYI